jgi:hypothetical protein
MKVYKMWRKKKKWCHNAVQYEYICMIFTMSYLDMNILFQTARPRVHVWLWYVSLVCIIRILFLVICKLVFLWFTRNDSCVSTACSFHTRTHIKWRIISKIVISTNRKYNMSMTNNNNYERISILHIIALETFTLQSWYTHVVSTQYLYSLWSYCSV